MSKYSDYSGLANIQSSPLFHWEILCLLFAFLVGLRKRTRPSFTPQLFSFLGKPNPGSEKNMFSCEVCCELPRILIERYELLNDA